MTTPPPPLVAAGVGSRGDDGVGGSVGGIGFGDGGEGSAQAEEKEALLRALLETIPAPSLASLAEKVCGRTVESVSQLSAAQVSK